MCGIAGIYHIDGSPADAEVLSDMSQVLRHRGPDAHGAIRFSLRQRRWDKAPGNPGPGLEGGLAVRRLRIRGLNPQADQPFPDTGRRVWLAFNGEIYNADELRQALQAEGVDFVGRSDTEVVSALYRSCGFEAALQRLEGMFALALADLDQGRLYLARDRFGIKPLHWYQSRRGTLLFASEIKAFLMHPEFAAELDTGRLDEFLTFRYCAGAEGLLKGVRQIQPGHWMLWEPTGATERRYWAPPRRAPHPPGRPHEAERLTEELRSAVRRHLAADVAVGCQLSGGIDSSMIALHARSPEGGSIPAYTVIPDHPDHSEEPWAEHARRVIGAAGDRVLLDGAAAARLLRRATWHLDQPVTHPNSLGLLLMAERASRDVRVLLCGEGADELLGGYTRFLYVRLLPWIRAALPWVGLAPGIGRRLGGRFASARRDPEGWFLMESAFLTADELAQFRPSADRDSFLQGRRDLLRRLQGGFLDRCLRYEMQTYLPDLLIRQDKMSMAHAVEVRVPYLDDRFAAYAFRLAESWLVGRRPALGRMRSANTKVLLKRAAAEAFGADFAYRPKMGFSVPIRDFMLHPGLRDRIESSVIPGLEQRGWVEPAALRRFWNQLTAGDETHQEALWICLALEVWAQEFLDGGWKDHLDPTRPASASTEIVS